MFNKAQSLAKYESFFIPIIYFLILILLSPIHNTFDEWGGVMQFFAGQEIFSGLGYYGWAAGFWPPLYSILIGVGSKFTNGFDAGKLISIFSATILIYVIYQLSQELTGRRTTSLLAQLFLALSPIFVFQSIDVHNHMLNSLLLASGIWLFIKSSNKQKLWIYFLTGLVCGLAALTRFTSYILLILPFFSFIFDHALGKFFRRACAFWIGSFNYSWSLVVLQFNH